MTREQRDGSGTLVGPEGARMATQKPRSHAVFYSGSSVSRAYEATPVTMHQTSDFVL